MRNSACNKESLELFNHFSQVFSNNYSLSQQINPLPPKNSRFITFMSEMCKTFKRLSKVLIISCILLAVLVGCTEKPPVIQAQNLTNQTNTTVIEVIPEPQSDFKVVIPKLDKGISMMVKYKDQVALFDAGGKDCSKQLITLLDSNNVTTLGYIFVSSNKFFRTFGLPTLFLKYDCSNFYDNGLLSDTLYAEKQSSPIPSDQDFTMGKVNIKALIPYDQGKGYSLSNDENNIVFFVTYNKTRILYLGDCKKSCLDRIGNLPRTDVIVTPLCADSIDSSILKVTKPSLVIISNNANYDDCPSAEIKGTLDLINIKTLSTDTSDVSIYSDGETITVRT
jgi:beta-lactamase superfamily II metal-dependent hydrolase